MTNGVTITAVSYAEELVGAALKPYRNQIVLATKFGIHFNLTSSQVNKPPLDEGESLFFSHYDPTTVEMLTGMHR